ncbi:CAP domain-containing protein [Streptomyces sp. NPDC052727]|uniref:CAP domain-containing protein n=1 Tax=Streptomyces sp. NPDC052727 TaxID=3154854 RepID=UPI0034420B19
MGRCAVTGRAGAHGRRGRRPHQRRARAGRAAPAGRRPAARHHGETIPCGQRSPAGVVDGCMNSPGHRGDVLGRGFTHIGVGFTGGGRAGTYGTQLFGG